MASPLSAQINPRPLDAVALARVARRLQAAAEPPWLHGEVARRMAERLALIKLQPERVLDWGGFLGASRGVLAQAYPQARVTAVEASADRRDATAAERTPAWWSPARWRHAGPAALCEEELTPGCCQLVWCNMQLHGALEPPAMMRQWHRALEVGGFLMFSALGPGSLASLRRLYETAGWAPAMAPLIDMHDLGDMLVEAGFSDPVMDQETVRLTWPTPQALLDELRGLGGNVSPQRQAGLRTPRWRVRLLQALEGLTAGGERPGLEFELVYGHAFRQASRIPVKSETTVGLGQLREMLGTPPRPASG